MKKKKIFITIFIITILFVKLFVAGELFKKSSGASSTVLEIPKAIADTNKKVTIEPVDSSQMKDPLSQERSLMKALEQRQRDIANRERRLQDDEQRLQALKQEIVTKIDVLIGLEERLNSLIETAKATESKKYKDLARVYDATPADKVSAMLEKMDTQTAAHITMNMKKDKAGAVLGHLNPQRAIEITKEITRISGAAVAAQQQSLEP
ncbi:MAG: hypothetical protein LBV07_00990 [Syntrophobacterales bacterium]|jgi:flagellar motility protein MotE (MotC chaperone)|nr:hypothetical protein [Syntrophobacterales bacterium]